MRSIAQEEIERHPEFRRAQEVLEQARASVQEARPKALARVDAALARAAERGEAAEGELTRTREAMPHIHAAVLLNEPGAEARESAALARIDWLGREIQRCRLGRESLEGSRQDALATMAALNRKVEAAHDALDRTVETVRAALMAAAD